MKWLYVVLQIDLCDVVTYGTELLNCNALQWWFFYLFVSSNDVDIIPKNVVDRKKDDTFFFITMNFIKYLIWEGRHENNDDVEFYNWIIE